jgi:hypothetical protein
VLEEMTIIEKLQQIEPIVRRSMNGYNADVIREAIEELKKLQVTINRSDARAYEVTIPGNLDSDPVQEVDLENDTVEGDDY